MSIKIALAQFEINLGNPQVNWHAGQEYIHQAAQENCRLVQLPELWISGYDLPRREMYSQRVTEWSDQLQSLADKHDMTIGGSMITREGDQFFNTYLLFRPGQPRPAGYHKTHLFRLLDEQDYFTPGEDLAVVDLGWCKVGLALCYDLRFPELIRAYTAREIDCLLVAAEWGQKRSDHWRTLLKARAIENQIFIAATNGIGQVYENQLAGYSAVIDPWGTVLAEAESNQPALLTAEIDLSEIQRVRQVVPSTADRRTALYRHWDEDNREIAG
ncbi:MAG TPA: nitrilase-related carbon-nitrogen hydrolase [Bellilinea sp.]|nr:nitrilase-related carbon-nitrogen hydrolase [Bellilinea sp.]